MQKKPLESGATMKDATHVDDDKDLPLREDTRLLGRLLGDVLRAQTGDDGLRAHRGDPPDGDPLPARRAGRCGGA